MGECEQSDHDVAGHDDDRFLVVRGAGKCGTV
jgi:hypothetical protein